MQVNPRCTLTAYGGGQPRFWAIFGFRNPDPELPIRRQVSYSSAKWQVVEYNGVKNILSKKFYQRFLDRVKKERAELQEDLANLSFDKPELILGDFGCGAGFISWCLLLEVPNSEVIGIDKYEQIDIPPELGNLYSKWDIENYFQSWSIESVKSNNKKVVDYVKTKSFGFRENNLLGEFQSIISESKRQPIIQKGDIVTGEGVFPNYDKFFDIVYCKRLLYPIYGGEYGNLNGNDGIKSAIHHISNTLVLGGRFCFVEVQELHKSSEIENFLLQAGFVTENHRQVFRPYKTLESNIDNYPYLIYQCRKI